MADIKLCQSNTLPEGEGIIQSVCGGNNLEKTIKADGNLEHKAIDEEAKLPEVSQGNICKYFQRSHFLKEAF